MVDVFLPVQNLVQSGDHFTGNVLMEGGSAEHSITVIAQGFTFATPPDTVFLQARPLENGKLGLPDEFALQVMSVDVDSIRFRVRRLDAHAGWEQPLRIDMLLFVEEVCRPPTNDLRIVGSLKGAPPLAPNTVVCNRKGNCTPELPAEGVYRVLSPTLTFLGPPQWSVQPSGERAQITSAADANPVTINLLQAPTGAGDSPGRWILNVSINTAQLGLVVATQVIDYIVRG